jgi:uncharacterized surface protein with fasciclin (FAS1) repeats
MKIISNLRKIALFAFIAITSFTSCDSDDDVTVLPVDNSIAGIAQRTPDLSILVQALVRTNLVGTLSATNASYTVFAPTNAAFNSFFTSLGANVTVNNVDSNVLKSILLNHVIGSEIKAAAIPAETYVSTLSPFSSATNSPTISMFVQKSSSNAVTINGGASNGGAVVSTADVDASNGVIHIVDKVIAIPTIKTHAIANPNFTTLVAALSFNSADNFVATLDSTTAAVVPFTVFAPVNSAFTAFLAELSPPPAAPATLSGILPATLTKVLKYHVVTGINALSTGLMDLQSIPTFEGTNVTVQKTTTGGVTTIKIKDTTPGRAACTVIVADVQCSNGVIHALDKVLLPQ